MVTKKWMWWAVVVWMGVGGVWGHGRLLEPPSRASAWRLGWPTPVDYNDNEGFCGGFTHQHERQGGRCGLCGDPWDQEPAPHEAGGRYATGTIVRRYTEGQVVEVRVNLTTNHRGHFEFRICPNNNPRVEATQTCLNQNPLFLADGSGFQYHLPPHTGVHLLHLKLPPALSCTQCVLQWRYVAGNNWGVCEDGAGRLGCGPQEEFRACADVAVYPQPKWTGEGFSSGLVTEAEGSSGQDVTSSSCGYTTPDPLPPIGRSPPLPPTPAPPLTVRPLPLPPIPTAGTTRGHPARLGPGRDSRCRAVGGWQHIPGMDQWCLNNCHHDTPFCPPTHCTCG